MPKLGFIGFGGADLTACTNLPKKSHREAS